MRLVLFDCDGTLADTFGLIVGTMRRCFEESGLPDPDEAAVRGIIGLSLDRAIHALAPTVPESELPRLVAAYKDAFHRVRAEGVHSEALFPGIEPMLRRLAARDEVLLGMVTGKSQRGVRMIVEAHGLEGLFLAVRTADDCPSKPHPAMVLECCAELGVDPADTVVIGDAIYDMQMAKAAGAEAIGVDWGAGSTNELLFHGANAVAATAEGLEAWIDDWVASAPSAAERLALR
ncbi:HAD-IA family hydrolase [Aureimonas sp. AU40]|uniref:HAD-IA family hydrolase n=1 Tax=Aureimonas sp. AU40 TaxID=1637747 RepID=UPI0007854640|nr:HAD-IA family hydrolase [Aureimonas sp. AU40]